MNRKLARSSTPHGSRPFVRFPAARSTLWIGLAAALAISASAAPTPAHGVVAANIDVVINTFDNDSNSVTLTTPTKIGDFRIAPEGSNNGDYDTQIGSTRTNDVLDGVMITSVRENGRDDNDPLFPGLNLATSHIDYHKPGSTNEFGDPNENAYWIPVSLTRPNSLGTSVGEWDINVAAAWFPYDRYLGGFARNSTFANGGPHDLFTGSPDLVLGTHYIDNGGGKAKVDLRTLGIDSRTDGVLLVVGAKNEDNYGLSQVNSADGTWNLFSKDNGTDGASTEQDPLAFVFIPKTDTNLISGRFLGNGGISQFSGDSPRFTITVVDVGTWELKIPGFLPRFGVLILSPEGGLAGNRDNIVTYQTNPAGDGWIIQSWDLPSPDTGGGFPPFLPPPLETPGDGTEPVADFVFIPGPTPGFAITPQKTLYTSEAVGTAQFSIALDVAPFADVTINLSSDNSAEGSISATSLTFTPENWETPQSVTITGQDDTAEDGPAAFHIVLSAATSTDAQYNGLNPADINVVNLDNEAALTVVPASGLVTTEAGGTATFDIVLNSAPTADVTINLSSSNPAEGTVAPSSVTFTSANWNEAQTVTVTGVDDSVQDGNVNFMIVTEAAVSADANFNGQNPPDVSVSNTDDDTAGLNVSAAGAGVIVPLIEGAAGAYTVTLNSQPVADVTITVTSTDTAQGGTPTPASLTFTPSNWNMPQTVMVAAADDLVADGDFSWALTNSITSSDPLYAALAPVNVSLTTLDNEAALALPTGEVFYGAGSPAVGIDGRATLADPNTTSYDGVTLTIQSTAGGSADDRLEIRSTGAADGQIGVSGNAVSYGGAAIGTFAGGSGSAALVVTFNAMATPQAVEALLRNITFRNVATNPSVLTRTVTARLAHTDGGTATAATSVRVGPFRIADFQEGADHGYGVYTGAADLEIFESQLDVPFPAGHSGTASDPRMWIDARAEFTVQEAQALLRFDNIIGNGPGQIPAGARIVSAELLLTVVDQGDGSPLYRMLLPWNEETDTWITFGNGLFPDGATVNATYDSQIGVQQVSGATGVGQINVGVTADVQAWADGAANYGWAMVSWDQDINLDWSRGTDGMAFRPSEAPIVDERPRLRVIWVPQDTPVAGFRQDVNSYTGAKDTRIRQNSPDAEGSTLSTVFVDWAVNPGDSYNPDQILIRFDDIIGTAVGQVPPNAHISAAILDLATLGGNAYGDGGQFFAMLSPWQETDTWNTLDDGISTNGVEAATTPSASAGTPALDPNVCGGYMSFEVTADVQAWANGSPNYGWVILPWDGGGDGWGLSTSEALEERDRPRLRIYYDTNAVIPTDIVLDIPTVNGNTAVIPIKGEPATAYTVLRATAVSGLWSSVGTVTTDASGAGTYTDNAPPADAAFYQVSKP